jgi:lysophospholipase L1-like esterase
MIARLFRPLVKAQMAMRRDQFEVLPLPERRVVFLGDRITEGGNWDEWFPQYSTLNRGLGSDTVDGVRTRLATAINQPAAVSLLIGTNDLGGQGRTNKVTGIAAQFKNLLHEIRALAPHTRLVVNSVMPMRQKHADRIRELNEKYAVIAHDMNADYVDLWPALADGDTLNAAYTRDRLHLNGHGYRAWVEVLRPHLVTALAN